MATAYGLSWKEIISTVTFGESLAKVIGTLDSLGKTFYTAQKDPTLPPVPETWVMLCLPVWDLTIATVNTGFIKTDFQLNT